MAIIIERVATDCGYLGSFNELFDLLPLSRTVSARNFDITDDGPQCGTFGNEGIFHFRRCKGECRCAVCNSVSFVTPTVIWFALSTEILVRASIYELLRRRPPAQTRAWLRSRSDVENHVHPFCFRCLQLAADNIALNEFGDFRSDHMRSQQFTRLRVKNRFHHAFRLA